MKGLLGNRVRVTQKLRKGLCRGLYRGYTPWGYMGTMHYRGSGAYGPLFWMLLGYGPGAAALEEAVCRVMLYKTLYPTPWCTRTVLAAAGAQMVSAVQYIFKEDMKPP